MRRKWAPSEYFSPCVAFIFLKFFHLRKFYPTNPSELRTEDTTIDIRGCLRPVTVNLPTRQSLFLSRIRTKKDCTRVQTHVSMETTREIGKTTIARGRTDNVRKIDGNQCACARVTRSLRISRESCRCCCRCCRRRCCYCYCCLPLVN